MFLTLCILRAALGAVRDLGKVTLKGAPSCSEWCSSAGHGDYGVILGTAPTCDGHCSDCNGACQVGAVGEFSDYGAGCWSGSKVCCCSASTETEQLGVGNTGADLAKYKLTERLPKTTQ